MNPLVKLSNVLLALDKQCVRYRAFKARMVLTVGTKFLSWGIHLVFNRDGLGEAQREVLCSRLKNAINANTDLGAQIESGGHILRDVQPIPKYVAYSVVNVLRDASMNLLQDSESEPVSTPQEDYGSYKEFWGSPTFHANQKAKEAEKDHTNHEA